jgi:hypothetical protein
MQQRLIAFFFWQAGLNCEETLLKVQQRFGEDACCLGTVKNVSEVQERANELRGSPLAGTATGRSSSESSDLGAEGKSVYICSGDWRTPEQNSIYCLPCSQQYRARAMISGIARS